jgi:peptidyl-prolyl cis-trans isomerase C
MLRAPALHFLVVGGLLFMAARRWDPPPRPRIIVTAADVDALRDGWTRVHGTPPDPAAERALVARAADDAILLHEAEVLGVDRRDPGTRQRLARLGTFVGEDPAEEDAAEAEARRLGLDRGDLVVRRHLTQMMRLGVSRLATADLPTEAELADWLGRHATAFAAPPRFRLVQVYLSRDRHGAALDADAAALRDRLRCEPVTPDDAPSYGDPFIRGADPGLVSRDDLERLFGADVARAVDAATPGEWVGPVRSPYGAHLVLVRERVPDGLPTLADVRSRVVHGLLAERRTARLDERMQALRSRYDVVMERP